MTGRRSLTGATALIALTLGAMACGSDDDANGAANTTPVTETQDEDTAPAETISERGVVRWTIALAAPMTAGYYPFFAADELGYFADAGFEITYVSNDEIPLQIFVANGSADISTPGASEVLFGAYEGIDSRVILDPWTNAFEGIVVIDDSPIQSLHDLAGKTLGLATDEDRAFAVAAATEVGLDFDEIDTAIVGEGGPTVANALENGTIDAYASTANVFAVIESQGIALRDISPTTLKETSSVALIASPERIEDEGDLLVDFLSAVAKGVYAGQVNPEAITAMYQKVVPEEWRDEVAAQATMEAALEAYRPVNDQMIGELIVERWTNAMDRLLAAGELSEPVDLEQVLDPRFIEFANDWDRDQVVQDAAAWLAAHDG